MSFSLAKLLRPEFKAFLDHEHKIISLVNDVADILEQAAAGPLHTPALYSCFLRALVSAKTEPPATANGQLSSEDHSADGDATQDHAHSHSHAPPPPPSHAPNGHGAFINPFGDPLAEFHFDSDMGPVADISTFPPTMAPNPTEDHLSMLTMDSILSSSFWDSVLVPGLLSLPGLSLP